MDDFIEYTVKKKTTNKQKLVRVLNWALMVYLAFMSIIWLPAQFVMIGLFAVVGYWLIYHFFIYPMTDLEYDYIYCEKEITIDKVLNKSRRKNIGKYDVSKIEAMAPSRSYHLDEYKNRTFKVVDFSSRQKDQQPDPTYTIFYDGKEKIILEPTKEFVEAVRNVAPRKVFFD